MAVPRSRSSRVLSRRQSLVEQAQKGRTVSHTELNTVLGKRTSARIFDFDRDSERAAMGELLGEVTLRERPSNGHMISAGYPPGCLGLAPRRTFSISPGDGVARCHRYASPVQAGHPDPLW
jgi:hypothetical protein